MKHKDYAASCQSGGGGREPCKMNMCVRLVHIFQAASKQQYIYMQLTANKHVTNDTSSKCHGNTKKHNKKQQQINKTNNIK